MMSKARKAKKTVSKHLPGDDSDPFDNMEGTVWKKFVDLLKWHPFFRNDDFPMWLEDYWIVRIVSAQSENQLCRSAVHYLYHSVFENATDRVGISAALRKGETIAVLKPDKKTAISAITFFEKQKNVVVLFLATIPDLENHGMASFLLRMLFQTVRSRSYSSSSEDISIYLLANETENVTAWAWYQKRGFLVEQGTPSFHPAFMQAFSEEPENSPLRDYLVHTAGLTWLHKEAEASDFFKSVVERIKHRFYRNPDSNDCPSVYAILPGKLTLHELDNCAPDGGTYSSKLLLDNVFTEKPNLLQPRVVDDDPGMQEGAQLRRDIPVSVCWTDRCFSVSGDHSFDGDFFDVIIAWLLRRPTAYIWTDCLTIIPINIMREVSKMQNLFDAYSQTKLLYAENTTGIFHPTIDCHRFMEASIPVMRYILQNKNLFIKHHIALLSPSLDFSWTCVIAVNAGAVKTNVNATECLRETCGFLICDPNDSCQESEAFPPPQCSFFLMLAFMVLNGEKNPPNASKKKSKRKCC